MEQKTKVIAGDGQQDLTITREFDLPLDLLFKAYTEPEIVEQWMGTKVVTLENKRHGGYQFETTDPKGNTYRFSGVIHEIVANAKIARTFEFEQMPFGIQLELLAFEELSKNSSKLSIHSIYESVEKRDQVIKFGMVRGVDMAHNRLQEIVNKLK